jgi:phosphatidylserine/phosphatidylglycerophosphate/cardiolipin synthase-like enzyme
LSGQIKTKGTMIMKNQIKFYLLTFILLLTFAIPANADNTFHNISGTVYFSPSGGCTEAIVNEINSAKSEIYVEAYSFTSAPIAKALVNAHKKGVQVEVILDRSQKGKRYTTATFLANAGIPTYIDPVHAIAHNKVMVIDKETVITGSFNFTKAAEEKNAENLLILKSKELASLYLSNWFKHKSHSDSYEGRE